MIEERKAQMCYVHRGITYLPHYSMKGYFVKPGMNLNGLSMSELSNLLFTDEDFRKAGAAKITFRLWPRTTPFFNIGY